MNKIPSSFSLLIIFLVVSQFNSSLSQTTNCSTPAGADCSSSSNDGPLCYYNTVAGTTKLRQTYGINKCFACSTRPVKIVNGECPGTTVYCDPRARPQRCATNQVPVCGYRIDSYGKIRQVQTFANPCTACKSTLVNHYASGKCLS